MSKRKLKAALQAALFALPGMAFAATAPGSGSLLQQIQQPGPLVPQKNDTGLTPQESKAVRAEAGVAFEIKEIRIAGNTLFDTATLHALVMDAEGKTMKVADLNAVAKRITDYYHSHGYPYSRAYLPAQTIRGGIVEIRVLEAKYGKINLNNKSRVNDTLLGATFAPLATGKDIAERDLDRVLLLCSDIPGAKVSAILRPGEDVGSSDLMIDVEPGPLTSSYVTASNYGNAYTGRAELSAGTSLYEPFRHGDEFTVNALAASNMGYGRAGYDTLLNGGGLRAGVAVSSLHYTLGNALASLDGYGQANVVSLWLRQPVMRSSATNLNLQVQYDNKTLNDVIASSATYTDRALNNWTATLSGDARDNFYLGGVNVWNVAVTGGRVGFNDAAAASADAATTQTAGGFTKWTGAYSRYQSLPANHTLYFGLSAQAASKNLDPAEKLVAGGYSSVRAYDTGALSGDDGYLATVELRHPINANFQAKAFVDAEHLKVNQSPWTTGVNTAALSGAGAGIDWNRDAWHAQAYLAVRTGDLSPLIASAPSSRLWFEVGRTF